VRPRREDYSSRQCQDRASRRISNLGLNGYSLGYITSNRPFVVDAFEAMMIVSGFGKQQFVLLLDAVGITIVSVVLVVCLLRCTVLLLL
jgi:hypothetical protein